MQAPDAREPQVLPLKHTTRRGSSRLFRHIAAMKTGIAESGLDYPLLIAGGVIGAVAITAGLQELQIMTAYKLAPTAVSILEQYRNVNLALAAIGGYVATDTLYGHFRHQ